MRSNYCSSAESFCLEGWLLEKETVEVEYDRLVLLPGEDWGEDGAYLTFFDPVTDPDTTRITFYGSGNRVFKKAGLKRNIRELMDDTVVVQVTGTVTATACSHSSRSTSCGATASSDEDSPGLSMFEKNVDANEGRNAEDTSCW